MKTNRHALLVSLILAATIAPFISAFGQGTAFTYQGRLNNGNAAANGVYDFKFSLATNLSAGTFINSSTNFGVTVTNGLFLAAIDFGGNLDGRVYWLDMAVRTNGAATFTTLSPRQPMTPAPYAMFANTASNLAGSLPATQISGALVTAQLPAGIITNGSSGVNLSGTFNGAFNGNGNGLSNIGSNSLAPGAALANLQMSGQSAVPAGSIVLSPYLRDTNLINAGYRRIGRSDSEDYWENRSNNSALNNCGYQSVIWTGSEILLWGGYSNAVVLKSGWRYNPSLDKWAPMNATNAPAARAYHSAIWTGSEMIVWGGVSNSTYYADGGRYNPVTDTWTNLSNLNAPGARSDHSAVWTDSEMIIWGGHSNTTYFATGGRYNPAANTWSAISTVNVPTNRAYHVAVWTGSDMIIWGGYNGATNPALGAKYKLAANTWTTITNSFFLNTPYSYAQSQALWTGSQMLLCGGYSLAVSNNLALALYNPTNDYWTYAQGSGDSPLLKGITGMTLAWTGSKAIIWGGVHSPSTFYNSGGVYDFAANLWTPTTLTNAPAPMSGATAVWTGNEMILLSGPAASFPTTSSYQPQVQLYLYQY